MTLLQRTESIAATARTLREKGRLTHHLQEVATARDRIDGEVGKVEAASGALGALRTVGAAPRIPSAAFEHGAAQFETLCGGERPSITADPSQVAPALKPISDARKAATRALQERHTEWREQTVGDLDAVTSFASAVKDLWPMLHVEVMRLVQELRVGRNDLPTEESIRRVVDVVRRLRQIPEEIAPTEEARRFLVAALGRGATFDDLTDPVRQWLREQGLEGRLRVRIAGSDDE